MRASGILLPLFSLPSPYGIGTFGKAAYQFIDFLRASNQRYWQLLPIGPTSYGDSPYQSFSTFAGNPYFIDLDMLKEQGLLLKEETDALPVCKNVRSVDYALLFKSRFVVLKKAFERFEPDDDYWAFINNNDWWLGDYALYMAIKAENAHVAWMDWPHQLKHRQEKALLEAKNRLDEDIRFHCFLQYLFNHQFKALKAYAGQNGVLLIGDIPIYVAMDSADTWVNPSLFMLDADLCPTFVAGCPPDYFSRTGQLWGNPLYNWDAHEKDDFAWWISRVQAAFVWFDVLRIDHFRGFASYYAIPFGDPTAQFGTWLEGPRMKLFRALKKKLGKLNIIAEDLGYQTNDVFKLLRDTGYPGMKVLQFAFDPYADSADLPHNYTKKCVAYTGTHDNTTVMGWMREARPKEHAFAKKYLLLSKKEGIALGFIRAAWASTADTAIALMQDFLGLGKEARINTPSTVGGNWQWRLENSDLTDALSAQMAEMTNRYGRNH